MPLKARWLSYGAKHGGRLPALSLGDVNTYLRILKNLSVGLDDVLLDFFFGPAFCSNWRFQEGQGADVPIAIDLDSRVEIRLSENSDVQDVAWAEPVVLNSLNIYCGVS